MFHPIRIGWTNKHSILFPCSHLLELSSEGMASTEGMASKPVKGEVVDIDVGNKRFKLIPEPFLEDYPGAGGNPYPTADIRRSMMQPSCSVKPADPGHGVGEHMVLYGYFLEQNRKPTQLVQSRRSWKERSTSLRTKLHFSSRFCFGMLGSIHLGKRATKNITWIGTSCFIVFESLKKATSTWWATRSLRRRASMRMESNGCTFTRPMWSAGPLSQHMTRGRFWCGRERLLSKDDMEAMAWQIDPNWDYPAKLLKGAVIKSSPFDASAQSSAPAGIWSSR